MLKLFSKIYSRIFPKPNGEEYNKGELIARAIIWGILLTAISLLLPVSIKNVKDYIKSRKYRINNEKTYIVLKREYDFLNNKRI